MRHSLLFCLISVVGCSTDGPELAEVAGTITMNGKPVPNATIVFAPQSSGGSPSYGQTDNEGHYSLGFTRKKTGAMIGTHDVTIETAPLEPGEADPAPAQPKGPNFVRVPKKYSIPGTLTATVEQTENTINFELDMPPR